ncbi:MAG: hypothetical protein WCR42_14125 [bacterium]
MEPRKVFKRRIDFIWPSIAIYFGVVLLYSIIRGSIHNWEFTILLNDPLIMLFSVFIILSALSYLVRRINSQRITISDNHIIFSTNFNERIIGLEKIESITFKQKVLPDSVQPYSIITLTFIEKLRPIHIWPPLYYDSDDLMASFEELKVLKDTRVNA